MAKIRGYSSYHGRGPLWKLVAVALLAAVILASFGLLWMERHLVVDERGHTHLDYDWQPTGVQKNPIETQTPSDDAAPPEETGGETESGTELAANPEEETASPVELAGDTPKAYTIMAAPLTEGIYQEAAWIADEGGYNAVSVRLKDEEGVVYFDSSHIIETQVVESPKKIAGDTTAALQALIGSEKHSIARICCFLDDRVANGNPKARLRNLRGTMFVDGNSKSWIDPGKEAARTYLWNLAKDAAELGFDEILLTAVTYPTAGPASRVDVGEYSKEENLSAFLAGMRDTLREYEITLSIEVPKTVLLEGDGGVSGLSLDVFAPWVDRVYAQVEPEEVQRCTDALTGILDFVPELLAQPEPDSMIRRYLVYPF